MTDDERTQEIKDAVLSAAEEWAYEWARSPHDRMKYIHAKSKLYAAVREMQLDRGDEDLGGPTPPPVRKRVRALMWIDPALIGAAWRMLLAFAVAIGVAYAILAAIH